MKTLLVGGVEFIAFAWFGGLLSAGFLEAVSSTSMPEVGDVDPAWGWLLLAGVLGVAGAVILSVVFARRAGREPRWAVRTTLVVLPAAFAAQLAYAGAWAASLPHLATILVCALCFVASVSVFRLTREMGRPAGQSTGPG